MSDDASLSDFLEPAAPGEPTPDSADDASDGGENAGPAGRETAADSGPATGDSGLSTYAWGAYDCSRCGTDTDRVWRADDEFVCPDCKSW